MKKQLISIAIASVLLAGTAQNVNAADQQTSNNRQKQYIGTGIGATAGALFAGPVGFIAGGLIGNLAARHDATDDNAYDLSHRSNEPGAESGLKPVSTPATEDRTTDTIVIAQAGETESIINDDTVAHDSVLKNILVENLSLDVFFLSGSTTVEAFYRPRLQTLARFMQTMPDVDIHLEGYADRRGDKEANLALSSERLDAVRDELIQAGIDAARIHTNAFGEQQFVSRPGDLEAYNFDRRVVIRFQQSTPGIDNPLAQMDDRPSL